MIKLGSHTPFTAPDYLKSALNFSLSNDANTMMIYLGAPQNTRRIEISKYKLEEFIEDGRMDPKDIVIHAPYIVNPASVEKHEFAIEFLIKDCERMNYIGAKYMVLHPGAHTSFTREQGIDTLVKSLKEILSKTKDVEILLETMAGKGTEIGTTFEEMELILNKVNSPRLGVCLDTCHVWEAGYDIRDFGAFINELKKTSLLDKIKVLHINDSKNKLGAHKDRHENIGKGEIGFDAIQKIIHCKEFASVIKILETPYVDKKQIYKEEIALLK